VEVAHELCSDSRIARRIGHGVRKMRLPFIAAFAVATAVAACVPSVVAGNAAPVPPAARTGGAAGNAAPVPPTAGTGGLRALFTFCPAATSPPRSGVLRPTQRLVRSVVSSLPHVLRKRSSGLVAGATLFLARRGLSSRASGFARAAGELRLRRPLQSLRRAVGRAMACMHGSAEERQERARLTYLKTPSVVTWHQPRCLLQGRKKELLLQVWVTGDSADAAAWQGASPAAEQEVPRAGLSGFPQGGKTLWTGLGCNQSEFRLLLAHVTGRADEVESANITEVYVDLSNQTLRADLRERWYARTLVLKDKSLKTSMAADQSLVGDVKGYLSRMYDFENELMTQSQLLDWLRASWLHTSLGDASRGGDPYGSRAGAVEELKFAGERGVNETGTALKPMLDWFRGAYPYYHQRCLRCGTDDTVRLGTMRANASEELAAAARTEIYYCNVPACRAYSRFPRYNQLRKVLEEGRGRCGEYSMVFYHLMLALGYKTRWVVDWTDHVWVEVLIQGSWVHIDPCEAAYNEKKMYVGWGKKHTYIVAFRAREEDIEFEDVTAEYADDIALVRRRRDLSDADLANALHTAVDEWNKERDPSVKLLARSPPHLQLSPFPPHVPLLRVPLFLSSMSPLVHLLVCSLLLFWSPAACKVDVRRGAGARPK
jgi:hypothetical protein